MGQICGECNEYEMLIHFRILYNMQSLYFNIYIIVTKACHKYDHGVNAKLDIYYALQKVMSYMPLQV